MRKSLETPGGPDAAILARTMQKSLVSLVPVVGAALLGTALSAQNPVSYIAPFGYQSNEGNRNNAIPWWAGSATYQQVHDATDLVWVFPTPVALIRGISFRVNGGSTLGARTMDAQVTLGVTTVTAATATATFAANLGPNPTVTRPYAQVNLPAVSSTSTPNPQAWFFPFATPFVYTTSQGNLCWELRFRNSSSTASATADAVNTASGAADFLPLFGGGCTASGQAQPATIGVRSLDVGTGVFVHRLERAAPSSPATLFLGAQPQQLALPGMCAGLETPPLVLFSGTTDATGAWQHTMTLGNLAAFPRGRVYAQFVFADGSLPYGLGVSPCSAATLPGTSTFACVRIYAVPSQSGQGNETATTGTVGRNYGLVVGFDA